MLPVLFSLPLSSGQGAACPLPDEAAACCRFFALRFNVTDFARYNAYFQESSQMTLLQAGTYKGADGIEEYVRFASPTSPYVLSSPNLNVTQAMKGFDGTTCFFRYVSFARFTMSQPAVDGAVIDVATYFNIDYDPVQNYIPKIQVARPSHTSGYGQRLIHILVHRSHTRYRS